MGETSWVGIFWEGTMDAQLCWSFSPTEIGNGLGWGLVGKALLPMNRKPNLKPLAVTCHLCWPTLH